MNNTDKGTSKSSGIQPEIAVTARPTDRRGKSKSDSAIEKKSTGTAKTVAAKAATKSDEASADTVIANRNHVRILDAYQVGIRVWPD